MFLKSIFDRIASFFGLIFLFPVLIIVGILIHIKMPGGPVLFTQRRV
ncbi:sugar transferase, partial [Bacteroides fluxus]